MDLWTEFCKERLTTIMNIQITKRRILKFKQLAKNENLWLAKISPCVQWTYFCFEFLTIQ